MKPVIAALVLWIMSVISVLCVSIPVDQISSEYGRRHAIGVVILIILNWILTAILIKTIHKRMYLGEKRG